MTVNQITSLTVNDLTSIEITCDLCESSVTLPMNPKTQRGSSSHPEEMLKRRYNCPCGNVLWSADNEHADNPVRDFVRSIFEARRKNGRGTVKLKIG